MKKIKWKPWPTMKPGDSHIHEAHWSAKEQNLRYDKGHYVTRPYLKYSSSKWEASYIDFYDILFNPWKYKPDVTLLEYGVYTGESIRYFRDYFTHPDAKIVGFDHQRTDFYCHDWNGGYKYTGPTHNVTFFKGEQKNADDVKRVCQEHGPFDIVVDDASHDPHITEDVFRRTWPYLKENGLYCIEDISVTDIGHLVDEITVQRQGRGFTCKPKGFGPRAGDSCVAVVLLKSKDSVTGIDEDLTE